MKPLVLICSEDAEFYLYLSLILEVDGFATELAGGVEETVGQALSESPMPSFSTASRPALWGRRSVPG
ncbi:hypothetical protein [Mesorhizobium sp. WSM2239]|uniref:Response regulatory domain-containing protein n=2 Tax=unclassified Mesorhizobium TaxID=325217 RepID=A0AAU8D773_9HYPH